MVAIAGDHLIAVLDRHLHADDDRLLADIEVAEPSDETHPVHLPGLLLEAPDQQHLAVGGELLLLAEFGHPRVLASDSLSAQDRRLACFSQRPYFSSSARRPVGGRFLP